MCAMRSQLDVVIVPSKHTKRVRCRDEVDYSVDGMIGLKDSCISSHFQLSIRPACALMLRVVSFCVLRSLCCFLRVSPMISHGVNTFLGFGRRLIICNC
jgi:hypothetical protein